MKRAKKSGTAEAVGRSGRTGCSAVSIQVDRACSPYPECEDEIRISICGGMSGGGTDLVISVPYGHSASDVRIYHTEGEGAEDLHGNKAKYSFKPNPRVDGAADEQRKKDQGT